MGISNADKIVEATLNGTLQTQAEGKLVLPKAILHNRKYNIIYADEKDLTKILCAEIDFIKANYYMCPVYDLRLRETSEKIGRMVQSLTE